MEKKKEKRGRGRPRKYPVKPVETGPKRKRGRPKKGIKGSENIIIKGSEIIEPVIIEEEYKEPRILRKKRVFRLDKSTFHQFVKKFNGNIIVMSYIVNRLMELYTNKDIKPIDRNNNYYEWCNAPDPKLEPLIIDELEHSRALLRGVPLQYKYSFIIDSEVFSKFQSISNCYPPFIINKLIQMYLDEKNKSFMDKHIKIDKAESWCNI